jgi:hypothetical protein
VKEKNLSLTKEKSKNYLEDPAAEWGFPGVFPFPAGLACPSQTE